MIEIRYAGKSDRDFRFSLDKHLPEAELESRVLVKRGYVLLDGWESP